MKKLQFIVLLVIGVLVHKGTTYAAEGGSVLKREDK